jgi:hypothetical protein
MVNSNQRDWWNHLGFRFLLVDQIVRGSHRIGRGGAVQWSVLVEPRLHRIANGVCGGLLPDGHLLRGRQQGWNGQRIQRSLVVDARRYGRWNRYDQSDGCLVRIVNLLCCRRTKWERRNLRWDAVVTSRGRPGGDTNLVHFLPHCSLLRRDYRWWRIGDFRREEVVNT